MKKNMMCIGFMLITNIVVYLIVDHYARRDNFKETSQIYKRAIANYIVWLSQYKPKKVQKAMANQILFEIVDLGKGNIQQDEVTYICESWNQGLNDILKEVYLRPVYGKDAENNKRVVDLTDQTTSLYLKGADRMESICAEKER